MSVGKCEKSKEGRAESKCSFPQLSLGSIRVAPETKLQQIPPPTRPTSNTFLSICYSKIVDSLAFRYTLHCFSVLASSSLKAEAAGSSKISVHFCQSTRWFIPDYRKRKNSKSHINNETLRYVRLTVQY